MKRISLSLVAVLLLSTTAIAQEASTPTETTVTCCTIRVEGDVAIGATAARVEVAWVRSDGSFKETRAFAITDGETGDASDNWLWGNGVAPQPNGFMRAVMFAPTGETGASLKVRFNKRVLVWLRTNGKIGATEITIPE
jgi:hypothetical protein